MQNKSIIAGKVEKHTNKKQTIKKNLDQEYDLVVEVEEDGEYDFQKLSLDGLPTEMHDGAQIRWLNNFFIKKNRQYINQKFFVTIPDIQGSRLVIYDGNGDPYYYTGTITKNTFELTDGDPAVGRVP